MTNRNGIKNVRAGVIGVGYLGRFHAEKYAAMEGVELVGVADPDQSRASELAAQLNTLAYREGSDLVGRVDAVSIVAPTVLHHRIAKLFLDAGVHVLLEKPITVTLEQADELIGLAARRNVILQIGHIERFNPAVTAIRPLLQLPKYLQAERSAPFTIRCTDVNVVLDLMIHDLDIVCDLAGSAPTAVSAAGAAVITKDIDTASARILFENGCVADVAASRVSEEKKRLLKVFEGTTLYTADFQAQKATISRRKEGTVPEFVAAAVPTDRSDTLQEEIGAFVRSVRSGDRPRVSGIEGRKALALALRIAGNIERGVTEFTPLN